MTDTAPSISDSHQQQESTWTPSASSCEMCCYWKTQTITQATTLTQLQNRLVDRDLSLARLQQDMHQLNSKYVAEIERAADLQHQKDLVEHDLEDLSCKLFEEANGMVAVEKRENWRLEAKLQNVEQQLGDEQAQLAELRQRLLQWDQNEQLQYSSRQDPQRKHPLGMISTPRMPQKPVYLTTQPDEEESGTRVNRDSITTDTATSLNNIKDTRFYTKECIGSGDIEWTDDNDEPNPRTWKKKKDGNEHEKVGSGQVHAYHDLSFLHRDQQTTTTMTTGGDTQKSLNLSKETPIKQQQHQELFVPISPIPSSVRQHTLKSHTFNQIQWKTFQQFVHHASSVPLKKLHQLTYLQTCQIDDVEPCLRFGPRSRLSPKKMMDYLQQQSCFIQYIPTTQQETTSIIPSSIAAQRPFIWDRWQSSKPDSSTESECAACGQSQSATTYQFKMDEKDSWMPMDKFCRDRLVAVCEFFVFVRNIHLCLYAHRNLEDLYWENIRLRLQMFHSRTDALAVAIESEVKLCPPLDQDDASDGSVSSFYPSTPR